MEVVPSIWPRRFRKLRTCETFRTPRLFCQPRRAPMPRHRVGSWLFLCATVLAWSAPVTSQERALAITGVNVVDVIAGRMVSNSTATVRGATISDVWQNAAAPSEWRENQKTKRLIVECPAFSNSA